MLPEVTGHVTSFLQCLEFRLWPDQHPLRQMETSLTPELLWKMEERGLTLDRLQDMGAREIGAFLRHPSAGTPFYTFFSFLLPGI